MDDTTELPDPTDGRLSRTDAEEAAAHIYTIRGQEHGRLRWIRDHINTAEKLSWLPGGMPREIQALAQAARLPMLRNVVFSTSQQMAVDFYTSSHDPDGRIWGAWNANRWDRKQIRVHKDGAKYGAGYGTVWPGDNGTPVLRPYSPLQMTATYTDPGADDWPAYALTERHGVWWLYAPYRAYLFTREAGRRGETSFSLIDEVTHGAEVSPVVRYLSDEDSDDPVVGDVEPLIPLQTQLTLTGFHLLVAQHYGAHGRRVIIGKMMRDIEKQLVQSAANSVQTISARPEDVELEEFRQTDLSGFLSSREAILTLFSTLGQMPITDLGIAMANLSAAALEEARESPDRKIAQRETIYGSSHAQLLGLAGTMMAPPIEVDYRAEVRWKPVRVRQRHAAIQMVAELKDRFDLSEDVVLDLLPMDGSDIARFRADLQARMEQGRPFIPEDTDDAVDDETA